ncbi:hypothetical protein COCON_G00070050 [Conger conger]|uniref:Uncharacterized protein n=1 Tax=Conger conger TaxID=82655 RepID=A0A9Q1DTC7_CONCO|nr:hypothetical protein COCON_G00070050 [Conger conger]
MAVPRQARGAAPSDSTLHASPAHANANRSANARRACGRAPGANGRVKSGTGEDYEAGPVSLSESEI